MSRTKKPQERRLTFDRLVGILTLTIDGKESGYYADILEERPGDYLAIRLTPFLSQQRPDQPENYDVCCSRDGARSCECMGFLRHGHCKHADAIAALVARHAG